MMTMKTLMAAVDDNQRLIDAQSNRFRELAERHPAAPTGGWDSAGAGALETVVGENLERMRNDLRAIEAVRLEPLNTPPQIEVMPSPEVEPGG